MKNIIIAFVLMLLYINTYAKNQHDKVAQAEKERYAAMIAGDTFALAGMMTSSLVYYHSNGKLDTKQSLLQSIANKEIIHKNITIEENLIRIYQQKTAIVTGRCTYDINYHGTDMQLHFVFANVYIKLHGKWLLVNRQTTKID